MLIGENGERVTAVDAALRAEAIAASLYAAGVRAGTRVAWQLPNMVDAALISLALARLGAVQIPVKAGVDVDDQELPIAVTATRPDLVLVPRVAAGTYETASRFDSSPAARVETVEPQTWSNGDRNILPPYTPGDWEPRWLFARSQADGAAVTVRHTDLTLSVAGRGLVGSSRFDRLRNEVGAVMTPIAEAAGLVQLAALIASPMPALLMQAREPAHVVGVLRQFGVRLAFGTGNVCRSLLEQQRALPRGSELVPQLRSFVTSGRADATDVAQEMERELGIAVAHDYGRCEVPLICAGGGEDIPVTRNTVIGSAIRGVSVRITNNGVRARVGVYGDIEVSGAGLFAGYAEPRHNDAALTHDGWFRTGDRGKLTHDGKLQILTVRSDRDER